MSTNGLINPCLYDYIKRVNLRELDFKPIKDTETFLDNYKNHDVALKDAMFQYIHKGWIVYPLGVDVRDRRVIVENDIPDLYLEKIIDNELISFLLEIKSKTSEQYFGWINKRAVKGYFNLTDQCSIPLYIGYAKVLDKTIEKWSFGSLDQDYEEDLASDLNVIYKYRNLKEGLPFIPSNDYNQTKLSYDGSIKVM